MKCPECGSKCIKVEVAGTTIHFECPSCCNEFTKHVPLRAKVSK